MPWRDVVVADVAVVAADPLVAAGAEGLVALAGEDDDADLVVVAGAVERVSQLEERLRPEGVAHLGAVDRDLRDALGNVVLDVVVVGRLHPVGTGLDRGRRVGVLWCGGLAGLISHRGAPVRSAPQRTGGVLEVPDRLIRAGRARMQP